MAVSVAWFGSVIAITRSSIQICMFEAVRVMSLAFRGAFSVSVRTYRIKGQKTIERFIAGFWDAKDEGMAVIALLKELILGIYRFRVGVLPIP